MTEDGVRALDRGQAWRCLESVHVGRLATSVGALPLVVPVHFLCAGDALLFAVEPGSTLARAVDGGVFAFEASGRDDSTQRWWTVIVRGQSVLGGAGRPSVEELRRLDLDRPAVLAIGDPQMVRAGDIDSLGVLPALADYLAGS